MSQDQKAIPDSIFNSMLTRKDLYMELNPEYRRIFGIGMWDFMDLLTGFNVVKFDDWLKTPDGTSTADWLKQKYGDEAHDLVKRLIRA